MPPDVATPLPPTPPSPARPTPTSLPSPTSVPSPAPGAVLWDLDGTLIDSEPYWMAGQYALVEQFGGTWDDARAHRLVGRDLLTSAGLLRSLGGVPLEREAIVDHLVSGVVARLRERIPWRPGAVDLLAALRDRGVPCALVTASYRRLVAAVVEALPAGSFVASVCGDEVTHGKPHPEPYLTAAARLGVAPSRCVAVEDSVAGAASATAAGIVTLGVPCVVPLPVDAVRRVVPTLVGITVADLAALLPPSGGSRPGRSGPGGSTPGR